MISNEAEIALSRQLESMRVGACVRARMRIVYAWHALVIEEGTIGTIEAVSHGGSLVAVRWSGEKDAIATIFSALEVKAS